MSEAVNLVGNPVARAIYHSVMTQPLCLNDLSDQLRELAVKQTIAKYLGEMELRGILATNWSKGEDGRWRRCYTPGSTEWSRLFKEVIELESNHMEV